MCGLVGAYGSLTLKDRDAFEHLLYVDALRGHHSTGVANASEQRAISVYKKAFTALDFLDSKKGSSIISQTGCALIGHNRWATKGAVNAENAHPFTYGNITGVHNGTLTNQSLLPDSEKFDVDSENLYYSMNKIGVDETIGKLQGAAALVWWDDEDKSLHIWRNKARTLWGCYSKDKKRLMWASEEAMLLLVTNQEHVGGYKSVQWEKPFLFKEQHVITYTRDGVNAPLKCSVRKVEDYKAPAVTVVKKQSRSPSYAGSSVSPTIYKLREMYPQGKQVTIENIHFNPTLRMFVGHLFGEAAVPCVIYSTVNNSQFDWSDELTEKGSKWFATVDAHQWISSRGKYGLVIASHKGGSLKKLDPSQQQPSNTVEKEWRIEDWDCSVTQSEWNDMKELACCASCDTVFDTPDEVALWDHGMPYCKTCQ